MATASLADITAQIRQHEEEIARLKAAAEARRKEEIASVTADIRAKIAEYGISAKELGLAGQSRRGGRAGAKPARPGGPVYRGPGGASWIGGTRGRKPRWLAEQLANGKTLADLAA